MTACFKYTNNKVTGYDGCNVDTRIATNKGVNPISTAKIVAFPVFFLNIFFTFFFIWMFDKFLGTFHHNFDNMWF